MKLLLLSIGCALLWQGAADWQRSVPLGVEGELGVDDALDVGGVCVVLLRVALGIGLRSEMVSELLASVELSEECRCTATAASDALFKLPAGHPAADAPCALTSRTPPCSHQQTAWMTKCTFQYRVALLKPARGGHKSALCACIMSGMGHEQVSAQQLYQLTASAPKGSKAAMRCSTAGTLPGSFFGMRNCACEWGF